MHMPLDAEQVSISPLRRGVRRLLPTSVRVRLALLTRDKTGPGGCSPWWRIYLHLHGFSVYYGNLFGLRRSNIRWYMNDVTRWTQRELNGPYSILFDDKLVTDLVFDRIIASPQRIAFLNKGIVVLGDGTETDVAGLADIIESRGKRKAVFKPIAGAGGVGVYTLWFENGKFIRNGAHEPDIHRLLSSHQRYLVVEFAVQHDYARGLYERTPNTIRMLTLRDPDTGEPFVSRVVHRVGNARSYPVDNWSRGGFSADVSVDTGQFGRVAAAGKNYRPVFFCNHPETGTPLTGTVIPEWLAIKEQVLQAHRVIPQVHVIAWDLLITQSGLMVIEANTSSDWDVLQVHKPLLIDARSRRFFEHHGLVR